MTNFWKEKGIPRKGWILKDVVDIREDGQSEDETAYESCMMCGNEKIRYVHILTHPELNNEYLVGCVCAERMMNDYINPKRREQELQNKSKRRANWLKKNWTVNDNGNYYLKYGGRHLLIYIDRKSKLYKVKIGSRFGNKSFDSLHFAKVAVFNGIEYFKDRGEW